MEEKAASVFVTDRLLAVLMTCSRSILPWDIVVTRKGDQLILDKRANSQIDYLTVNETMAGDQSEEKDTINMPEHLSVEATMINSSFAQQVLRTEERLPLPHPNPFGDGEDVASIGYRYRQWSLGDYDIVVRCEIDGVVKQGDKDVFLTIKALNEIDPRISGIDWKQKLDVQRGAVFATELKNNHSKLSRWAAEAVLAGTEQIKLGYDTKRALSCSRPRTP